LVCCVGFFPPRPAFSLFRRDPPVVCVLFLIGSSFLIILSRAYPLHLDPLARLPPPLSQTHLTPLFGFVGLEVFPFPPDHPLFFHSAVRFVFPIPPLERLDVPDQASPLNPFDSPLLSACFAIPRAPPQLLVLFPEIRTSHTPVPSVWFSRIGPFVSGLKQRTHESFFFLFPLILL